MTDVRCRWINAMRDTLERRLVFRRFHDVIFEPGATFCQQTIGQHLAGPLDRQVGRKDPHVGRGPNRPAVLRQFRIEEIGPDRHIHPVAALRMQVHDGAGPHHRIEVAPDRGRFVSQPMEPHGILRIEQRMGRMTGTSSVSGARPTRHIAPRVHRAMRGADSSNTSGNPGSATRSVGKEECGIFHRG